MKEPFGFRGLLLLVLLAGAIAGVWYFRSATPSGSTAVSRATSNASVASSPSVPVAIAGRTPDPSSPGAAAAANAIPNGERPRFAGQTLPAQRKKAEANVQLTTVSNSLRNYRMAFQQNPVGNNAEIMRVLSGKNARGANYLPADARRNAKGELTDGWDEPVLFHQISGTIMEIRSAGPDHRMWTDDDEVLR